VPEATSSADRPDASGPSERADAVDWRAGVVGRVRRLVAAAAPAAVEERKWRKPTNPAGIPTFSDHGLLLTVETYRETVKVTFAYGAELEDPSGLFNASLTGNRRRAIDIRAGDHLDEAAFSELVRRAVDRNVGHATRRG
jgi:hypothetical protein